MRRHPRVRKVFLDAPEAGATTAYWETQWLGETRTLDGPLRRLLEHHLPPASRVLEAGCGQGEVAAGLAALGHQVTGVDLARRALADCHRRHPDLDLAVADILRFPFADGTFDAVVSLGVVEHFEEGPQAAIDEHARVLADGGLLFVTVPARGWYRRWSDLTRLRVARRSSYPQRGRLVTNRRAMAPETSPAGAFHQYELPRSVIEGACRRAGLEITGWQPFGVAWALGDSPLIGRLARSTQAAGATDHHADEDGLAPDDTSSRPSPSTRRGALQRYLRDPIIEERSDDPAGRAVTWAATRALAHMQLVVATKPAP